MDDVKQVYLMFFGAMKLKSFFPKMTFSFNTKTNVSTSFLNNEIYTHFHHLISLISYCFLGVWKLDMTKKGILKLKFMYFFLFLTNL